MDINSWIIVDEPELNESRGGMFETNAVSIPINPVKIIRDFFRETLNHIMRRGSRFRGANCLSQSLFFAIIRRKLDVYAKLR